LCTLLFAAWCVAAVPALGQEASWDTEPYHIHATLAIDAPGDLAGQLAAELPVYLMDRVAASIGAAWRLELDVASGPLRHRVLRDIDALTAEEVSEATPDEEKRLFVAIRATPWGYQLAAREFDRYLLRWGTTIRRETRQRDAIAEQCFALVREATAPLARLRLDTENPKLVTLEIRGSTWPAKSVDFEWARPGDVFLPLFRRTSREGTAAADGIQAVPWTYMEVTSADDQTGDSPQIRGRLLSGRRQPLSARPRGRVEQVAIALHVNPRDAIIHLRSRTEADKPLVGYEVYAQDSNDDATHLVARSDESGDVRIPPGKSPVQLVFIKSGGVFLGRLPVVPGFDDRVDVPLPDDEMQLRAQARLAALREDLVDLVARRNIFMARVRHEIEEKNYEQARQLLELLDELPGRTQFNLTLEREARAHRTNDLQVQRRIDQLFTATQTVLGQFLDPRQINELRDELRQAQQPATNSGGN
jgi:hypothetical protein